MWADCSAVSEHSMKFNYDFISLHYISILGVNKGNLYKPKKIFSWHHHISVIHILYHDINPNAGARQAHSCFAL